MKKKEKRKIYKRKGRKTKKFRTKKRKLKKYKKIKKGTTKKVRPRKFKFDELAISELIKIGRPRGFITDMEILSRFPHIEEDILFLEEL